ncbi:MAG: TPM domain-containing protein [Firmicutes bacterium]|nr:TPM domain-containing protein [Bacillota bacterium]
MILVLLLALLSLLAALRPGEARLFAGAFRHAVTAEAAGRLSFPPPAGFANDFAGVLSEKDRSLIEALSQEIESLTTAEVVVAVVQTTEPLEPKDYATRLFEAWGIGKASKDNGVLVLLAMAQRRVEIETGYGVEPVLTDGMVGEILDTRVVRFLKQGDYGAGLANAVAAIGKRLIETSGESENSEEGGSPQLRSGWAIPGPRRVSAKAGRALGSTPALAVFLLAVFWLFLRPLWHRLTTRRCPSCGTRMATRTSTIVPPSVGEAGLAEVSYSCPKCGYQDKRRVPLSPLHVGPGFGGFGSGGLRGGGRGGGGGFGGGRSGGGGGGRGF